MSLDVSQRSQLELQKTVKRQSVQISELQTHYEEVHRQLQQAVDQLSGAQRRNQGLLAELEELRVALDTSLRAKRLVETSLEEIQVRVNELTQVNVNLASAKGKLESEYGALQADYDSVHKELRVADERVQRTLVDLKVTKDALVEETERYTRVETIRRTLETEVKSLTVRLTEVEASALAGGKRVISKLETRIRDAELELEDERRKHAESQKQLRKKEHRVKELLVASEEDHKAVALLQDTCDKLSDRLKAYKRQLSDQEGSTQQNLTRVRRFQRELEAAEDRAEAAGEQPVHDPGQAPVLGHHHPAAGRRLAPGPGHPDRGALELQPGQLLLESTLPSLSISIYISLCLSLKSAPAIQGECLFFLLFDSECRPKKSCSSVQTYTQ
ncbi:Paramyosin [Halotydeus destructor]|nr:Paramyosin [Halotydeus destructor]